MADCFGTAIALVPAWTERSMARLSVCVEDGEQDRLSAADLERLRLGTPAGRSLPLLALLARRQSGSVGLEYLGNARLRTEVRPC